MPPTSARLCRPQTSIKLMYWSFLVYDFQEQAKSSFQVDTALALYDLDNFELFWERTLVREGSGAGRGRVGRGGAADDCRPHCGAGRWQPSALRPAWMISPQDTKAIVGWSEDTVVIAFRGTASLANVKADLQVCPLHGRGLGSARIAHTALRLAPAHASTQSACRPGGPAGVARPLARGRWQLLDRKVRARQAAQGGRHVWAVATAARQPPARLPVPPRSAPQVHGGFLKAWRLNGFSERVLARLSAILERCTEQQREAGTDKSVTVYCTGCAAQGLRAACRWRPRATSLGCLGVVLVDPGEAAAAGVLTSRPAPPLQALAGRCSGHAVRLRHQAPPARLRM